MFELYVSLTNMYWLMCVMQRKRVRNIGKIFCNLSGEEHKTLMEKLQRDESSEKKVINIYYFLIFNNIVLKNIY